MLITFVSDVFMIQSVKEPLVFQLMFKEGLKIVVFVLMHAQSSK